MWFKNQTVNEAIETLYAYFMKPLLLAEEWVKGDLKFANS